MERSESKLKIERHIGNHYSYYMDVNGLLKGEWGGFKEDYGTGENGEHIYGIYYNKYNRFIPIDEFGFFYNKFDCRKYDGVIKLPNFNVYICEKNGRFGLIDNEGNTILHTAYNKIVPYFRGVYPGYGKRYLYLLKENISEFWDNQFRDSLIFIVTTETGKFLFNSFSKKESNVYDDVFIGGYEHENIIYKANNKFGILDVEGEVLLNPYLDFSKLSYHEFLYYEYHDSHFPVWIEDGLLYGKIPAKECDLCFGIGDKYFFDYYIFKKGSKYGILSARRIVVSEPILDDIILYNSKSVVSSKGCLTSAKRKGITFAIARIGRKYRLYNTNNGNIIIDNCDIIDYTPFRTFNNDKEDNDFIEFSNGEIKGYVLWNGKVLSTDYYEEVKLKNKYVYVKKEKLYGVYSPTGEELIPCVYDGIIDNNHGFFTVIKDDIKEDIDIYSEKRSYSHGIYERPTYERYAGTYAQDEAGYSDDDIDTIFDGDPSAYWNID